MSANTNTKGAAEQERIAGAASCLAVLLRLKQIVALDASDITEGRQYTKRDAAIAALLETAGELSPRAAGAMSLLAELVASETQDGSQYFWERWNPEALMTVAERDEARAQALAKDAAEMEAA